MKQLILTLSFIFILSCNKPKTVLICGDHQCINKTEAKQYFEENLTLEVKIIDKKKKEKFDLVELNINRRSEKKEINIKKKEKTNQKVKPLSPEEIKEIKKKIKNRKNKKVAKKETNLKKIKNIENNLGKVSKSRNMIDVCELIEQCTIEEISKYLIKMGKKKGFPDITSRN